MNRSFLRAKRYHIGFGESLAKSAEGVREQICQLAEGLKAECFTQLRDLVTSSRVDSIWSHWNNVWIRLEGTPPLFISIIQAPHLCDFPFDRLPAFRQFCDRFHGLLHSHPLGGSSFYVPTRRVTRGDYDPYFGHGLAGSEDSVPFYHDGSEIQVFLSPKDRVGFTCEGDGMIDTALSFGGFIERYVSDLLIFGKNESEWFDDIMLGASKNDNA